MTRESIPSYLPHANTSQSSWLHPWAVTCAKGTPDGVGTTRAGRPDGSVAATASSASPHGPAAHDHAGAAAVRRVVNRVMSIMGEGPQIVDAQVDHSRVDGLADEREAERLEVGGEDGDDVDAHAVDA